MGDEMVMIGKHRPRFQSPIELLGHGEQAAMQYAQAPGTAEVMGFLVGRCRDDVSSANRELVCGGVWPRRLGFGHGKTLWRGGPIVKLKARGREGWVLCPKAVEDHRTPGRFAFTGARGWRDSVLECASP